MLECRKYNAVMLMAATVVAEITEVLWCGDSLRQKQICDITGNYSDEQFSCQQCPDTSCAFRVTEQKQDRFIGSRQKDSKHCTQGYDTAGIQIRRHNGESALWDTAKDSTD